MEKEIVRFILPEDILKYFDITKAEELGEVLTKRMVLQIELEEKNRIP